MSHPTPCLASIADLANLRAAWRTVRRNRGGAGLDGMSLQAFQANLETHLRSIRQAVLARTYTPRALRRVRLARRGKRRRLIGVPTVADRVLQHAILNVLQPHLEPTFCSCSYGFRPGRSAHQAVLAVAGHLRAGCRWVVEADIEHFFDTLDRTILRRTLAAHVPDPDVLTLIERFLQAGVCHGQTLRPPAQGTPQGMGFSPLLANAYLTSFDRSVTSQGYRLVRYGDDCLTLHRTRAEATTAMRMIRTVLEENLRLRLKQEKTRLTNAHRQPFDFLSFRFRRGSFGPDPHAVERFQARVEAIVTAYRAQGLPAVATHLNPLIRGWGEYFKIGQVAELYRHLDTWIAARLDVRPGNADDIASLTAILTRYGARQETVQPQGGLS